MNIKSVMQRSVSVAALALIGTVPAAFAQYGQYGQNGQNGQGQEIFEWSGRVDREVQISMRNNQVATRQMGNNEGGRTRSRVFNMVPRQDGQVTVQVLNGRGNVDVIQQPSASNGFMTVVRIMDRSGGADNYRIAAYWQANANGEYIGRDRGVGRGRGRDRDRDREIYGNNGNNGNNGNRNGTQSLLHWTGNVDGELEIRIQNGRVEYRNLSGQQPTSIRADVGSSVSPRSAGSVSIAQSTGRGSVYVIQQPTSYNGYTTVIRVRDPQGGYGYYNFDVMWQ